MGKKGTGTTKNAVILAAGKGTRVLPLTLTIPKCLIDINGKSILERTLNNLSEAGITDVTIVVGYLGDKIQNAFGNKYSGVSIRYIKNPIFETTNSMYSLLLGLIKSKRPVWVIEGDIVFEKQLLDHDCSGNEISWFVDSSARNVDGAYLESGTDNIVTSLSIVRDLSLLKPTMNKSVGTLHLSEEGAEHVWYWLGRAVAKEETNLYYDLILGDYLNQRRINTVDIAPTMWCEVDTIKDLEVAREMFR